MTLQNHLYESSNKLEGATVLALVVVVVLVFVFVVLVAIADTEVTVVVVAAIAWTMHSLVDVQRSLLFAAVASVVAGRVGAGLVPVKPLPLENVTRLTLMAVTVTETDDKTSFNLAMDGSNVTEANFLQVASCARTTTGAAGQPIEVIVTLGLDVPVWKVAAEKIDIFGKQERDIAALNKVHMRTCLCPNALRTANHCLL